MADSQPAVQASIQVLATPVAIAGNQPLVQGTIQEGEIVGGTQARMELRIKAVDDAALLTRAVRPDFCTEGSVRCVLPPL